MRISDWSSDVCSSDLPRGLIDYCTLDDAATEKAGGAARPVRQTLLRPRTIVYFSIWCAIGAAMLFSLGQRTRLDLAVQHDRSPLYVQLSDGHIRNSYTLKLRNMETRPRRVEVAMTGLSDAKLRSEERRVGKEWVSTCKSRGS